MKQMSYGRMLTTKQVIQQIERAIRKKSAFSLVRVADGENLVLAQRHVWPIKRILQTRWGRRSRTTHSKGIRLPNEKARDRLIHSIKRADLVGIPHYNDRELRTRQIYLRPLTDKAFKKYQIRPKRVCHALVNRHLVEEREFWKMLSGRKVALISKWADSFANLLATEYKDFQIQVVKKIPFSHYNQIERTVRLMKNVDCDVVLISAGVSAVILAEQLARKQGRVAIDFGKSAMFMVNRTNDRLRPWKGEGAA